MADNGGIKPEGGVKTFTQEEVNAMIGKRVNEISAKFADYDSLKEKAGKYDEIEEKGKTELQKANERADNLQKQIDSMTKTNAVREAREKVSKETNVPAELLTGEDEETCKKQAEAIMKFANPHEYPDTKKNEHKKEFPQEDEEMRELAKKMFG